MAIADVIALGIGPDADIPHFTLFGLSPNPITFTAAICYVDAYGLIQNTATAVSGQISASLALEGAILGSLPVESEISATLPVSGRLC